MATVKDSTSFKPTEWLKLEFAVETVGDMIAYYVNKLHKALETGDEKSALEYEEKIKLLSREREQCYLKGVQEKIILKAMTEYGPFLKQINS